MIYGGEENTLKINFFKIFIMNLKIKKKPKG